jgi:transketolase
VRTAFARAVEDLAARDPRVCLLTGDLGFSVLEPFARRFPERFLNAGVAEQNMTGLAVGMALSGKIVFTYSIANFPTLRCLEQLRNDACYHGASVKVVSVGAGFSYGALGVSHHATEDMAVMRALPGMTVVCPASPLEAAHATGAVAAAPGPCYLRLGKAGEAELHPGPISFELGKALALREGRDLAILSCGSILKPCLEAAKALESRGLSTRVLSMHTVKPVDREAVLAAAAETRAVLSVEEHCVVGGLGSAVAEVLAQDSPRRVPFRILGIPDGFCRKVGSQDFLRKACGLSAEGIASAALGLLSAGESGGRRPRGRGARR